MDVSDYFRHREHALGANSVSTDEMHFEVAVDCQSGRMWGDITLTDDLFLSVRERVEVRQGGFEIVKYAYYVVADGEEVRGFDKDPSHDPPIHGHLGADHEWTAAAEITLEDALRIAWGEVELRATTYQPES